MPVGALIPLVAIPAGVAVGTAANGATPAHTPIPRTGANGGVLVSTPPRGATIGQALTTPSIVGKSNAAPVVPFTSSQFFVVLNPNIQPSPYAKIDQALQQKLDEINKYGKAAYDNLSSDAKKKSAAELSKTLKLDPPLSGKESWEDIAKIAGGAAGTAALGWLPGGQVLGPIVGAYLGVKLEELCSKNVEEIKTWFKSRWSSIESWVKGTASKVESKVSDAIHYIGGWF